VFFHKGLYSKKEKMATVEKLGFFMIPRGQEEIHVQCGTDDGKKAVLWLLSRKILL
jgi:hypothetical protein